MVADLPRESQYEINFMLPHEQARRDIADMCQAYQGIFEMDDTPLREYTGEMFRVHLTTEVSLTSRPYRHPVHKREVINAIIDNMLDQGIIRLSTSLYAAPVTLVLKKNGTYRLVVDFCLLNMVTILEIEPMSIVQDLLDATCQSRYYSKLDITLFFHHFLVHPDDRHKLAIVTQDGHYEFNRAPFRCKNAPFFCQRQI